MSDEKSDNAPAQREVDRWKQAGRTRAEATFYLVQKKQLDPRGYTVTDWTAGAPQRPPYPMWRAFRDAAQARWEELCTEFTEFALKERKG